MLSGAGGCHKEICKWTRKLLCSHFHFIFNPIYVLIAAQDEGGFGQLSLVRWWYVFWKCVRVDKDGGTEGISKWNVLVSCKSIYFSPYYFLVSLRCQLPVLYLSENTGTLICKRQKPTLIHGTSTTCILQVVFQHIFFFFRNKQQRHQLPIPRTLIMQMENELSYQDNARLQKLEDEVGTWQ